MYRKAVRSTWRTNRMPVETTYTSLRERLASVLDQVANDHEVVIVRRRHAKDVALVPAEELTSLLETAHLLRSPKNAQRLLAALQRATRGKDKPESVDKLRREMGLGSAR
jgi:antitoxin YefM